MDPPPTSLDNLPSDLYPSFLEGCAQVDSGDTLAALSLTSKAFHKAYLANELQLERTCLASFVGPHINSTRVLSQIDRISDLLNLSIDTGDGLMDDVKNLSDFTTIILGLLDDTPAAFKSARQVHECIKSATQALWKTITPPLSYSSLSDLAQLHGLEKNDGHWTNIYAADSRKMLTACIYSQFLHTRLVVMFNRQIGHLQIGEPYRWFRAEPFRVADCPMFGPIGGKTLDNVGWDVGWNYMVSRPMQRAWETVFVNFVGITRCMFEWNVSKIRDLFEEYKPLSHLTLQEHFLHQLTPYELHLVFEDSPESDAQTMRFLEQYGEGGEQDSYLELKDEAEWCEDPKIYKISPVVEFANKG